MIHIGEQRAKWNEEKGGERASEPRWFTYSPGHKDDAWPAARPQKSSASSGLAVIVGASATTNASVPSAVERKIAASPRCSLISRALENAPFSRLFIFFFFFYPSLSLSAEAWRIRARFDRRGKKGETESEDEVFLAACRIFRLVSRKLCLSSWLARSVCLLRRRARPGGLYLPRPAAAGALSLYSPRGLPRKLRTYVSLVNRSRSVSS